MFGSLFFKECRQILKSMVYYIYVVVFVMFLTSQLSGEMTERMEQPQPGQENYGFVNSRRESDIMEKTLAGLAMETSRNSYATYPMGFYKGVTLNETELAEVKSILENCSGRSWEQLTAEMERHYAGYEQSTFQGAMQAQISYSVPVREDLSYEDFSKYMEQVCGIIGAGSDYQTEALKAGVSVPMTYEQAMEEYKALCSKDRITGATARLFCDYAGIILSVLPVFLGVTRCLRDKRAQVSQVIFSHRACALVIIASRYLANVCMAFLPVVLTAFAMQMPYQYHAKTIGIAPDVFAFLTYSGIWLLPELMIVLAVSFFITEMTENVISIFIQVFWAIASLFSAVALEGNFGFHLIVRWNTLGDAAEFWRQRPELFVNRGFYFVLSLVIVVCTVLIYEKKRREGETVYGKIFKSRK
ncbi:MAG: ABC transporter permease [Lachnospiraceae bacterium]|nr:ABC transporter permease [Lachnospiraceae bacterium]